MEVRKTDPGNLNQLKNILFRTVQTSAVSKAANNLKQSKKNMKKRTTEEKRYIEIQMSPQKPKKVTYITPQKIKK
ncbi:UNVERIFIED_CONTAM: hypothetical protein NCL1_42753 [Trichonephila clavipes]